MDAPLCRLCKVKHWSNEPHVFKVDLTDKGATVGEQKARLGAQSVLPPEAKVEVRVPGGLKETAPGRPRQPRSVEETKTVVTAPEGQPEMVRSSETLATRRGSRDKYNERQREYMKERRALAKRDAKK